MHPALTEAVKASLARAGDSSPILALRHIGGGDINKAIMLETGQRRYFVKWHTSLPPRFFECEAHGLQLLAESHTARIPELIAHGTVTGSETAFLILEWIERGNTNTSQVAETLGRQLAEMHWVRQSAYGLQLDNYIGRLPQPNTMADSWLDFYREQRLDAQKSLALKNGHIPLHRAHLLDGLMDRLADWINEADCQPSLLHGDLWGGNWMQDAQGQPVLIDPAVYYGDREADIAMTALFGGFPQRFYDAYTEVFPLAAGYQARQPLYQLYYLLCHLNLFGESYVGQVDTILYQYVS